MSQNYLPQLAELRARRLIAQRLAASQARSDWNTNLNSPALSATHGMVALQGQNYSNGVNAIALRSGSTTDDVLAAISSYDIVRCWSQRGTLHFVSAQDAGAIMRLTNPRIEKAAARRRTTLGLSQDDVQTARAAFHSELRSRGLSDPLTRTEAYEVFADHGIDPTEQRGPHLLRTFGGEGAVVQGPRKGSEDTFVLLADVTFKGGLSANTTEGSSTEHSAESTLADIAWRYVNSRGPICVADFAWWLGLTKTQAKKAFKLIDHLIAPFSLDSSASPHTPTDTEFTGEGLAQNEYFMPAWQQNVAEAELEAALSLTLRLPAFDEYLMGYGSRTEVLPESLRNQVLTRNGISWPFVVEEGVITGRQ
ncbi:winged helix DNA-binding domain-containing protein [Corynebacterium jeikeium]|nr:winged helix DNA-binding domain-containing protein [Corynebacterium jeikeium]